MCGLRSANIKKKLLPDDYTFDNALKRLVVVDGSGPSLFERDWLAKIKVDWKKSKHSYACHTIQFHYLVSDVFQKLRGEKLFSKLDKKNACLQLLLEDESQQYVTINTHRGLYPYKRLPFGIAASPTILQRSIDVILQGKDNVAAIQDDILVTGRDDDDHLNNLEATFSRLHEHGVRLKLDNASSCTDQSRTWAVRFQRREFSLQGRRWKLLKMHHGPGIPRR